MKTNCCNNILIQTALYLEIMFSMYHYTFMWKRCCLAPHWAPVQMGLCWLPLSYPCLSAVQHTSAPAMQGELWAFPANSPASSSAELFHVCGKQEILLPLQLRLKWLEACACKAHLLFAFQAFLFQAENKSWNRIKGKLKKIERRNWSFNFSD